MGKIAKHLNKHLVGSIFESPQVCAAYSQDQSILKITPQAVAIPENTNDTQTLLSFVNQLALRKYQLPVTIRGAGLSRTGSDLGDGLLISLKRFNQVEEIDVRSRLVRVQPGITLETLNTVLSLEGLCLPIDANPKSTLGGLISEDPQNIAKFIDRAEIILPSGELIELSPRPRRFWRHSKHSTESKIYQQLAELIEKHPNFIGAPSISQAGYSGVSKAAKIRHGKVKKLNLLPLLFSAQGTLGVIVDLIIKVEIMPSDTQTVLIPVPNLKIVDQILKLAPQKLEILDAEIFHQAQNDGVLFDNLSLKNNKFVLMAQLVGSKYQNRHKIQKIRQKLPNGARLTPVEFSHFSAAKNSFLNANGPKTAILDGFYIPDSCLEKFINGLKTLEQISGQKLPIMGSYLTKTYSVRPYFNFAEVNDRQKVLAFMQQLNNLIVQNEGILAKTPEGRVKIPVKTEMPIAEMAFYGEIKQIFDPNNILNPDVKLGADLSKLVRHLRVENLEGIVESH